MDSVKTKIIKKLNAEFGNDFGNLKRVKDYHEKVENEKKSIEETLSLASSSSCNSIVQEALKEAEEVVSQVNDLKINCQLTLKDIEERQQQENSIEDLQELIDKISYLEKAKAYLRFVKYVENSCAELELSLLSGNDDACISSYRILKGICLDLQKSKCQHLKKYVSNTLEYWHKEIKRNFVIEYNEILKLLRWPFLGSNVNLLSLNTHNHETMMRFRILTEHLFHLQLPDHLNQPNNPTNIQNTFTPVCLPISLLVRPLKQRFVHHFTGNKQTNRRDKPEWFFTQIFNWIKDHANWVEANVQPTANAIGLENVNVKVEFMRALVRLAVEKLQIEIAIVQYDDSLFAHMIDEALGFERDLRDTLGYPQAQPVTVFVLTQPQTFVKWITMEKKFALEKMDTILSSETAWQRLPGYDDLKVTECAESFMTLLSTISDRYNYLPQPAQRLQFLDLQLELIDDWRVRLLQVLHENYKDPLESLMPPILNTLNHVIVVLQDWGINVQFSNLYFFKKNCQPEDLPDETVFDSCIALLERIKSKLLEEITDSIFNKIKSKSRAYRDEKWFSMRRDNRVAGASSMFLTSAACPMFQEISSKLHTVNNLLALPLFSSVWKNLALRVDGHLLEEVILENRFSADGAAQIQHDVKRYLLPLFGLYTNKPEAYFLKTVESCILLNILLGSAILLLEALEKESSTVAAEALAEAKIYNLSKEQAQKVLRTRIDLSVIRQSTSFEID